MYPSFENSTTGNVILSGYAKKSPDIRKILGKYGSTGLIEWNRIAVDQSYRKMGLGADLLAKSLVYKDTTDKRPIIFTKPINLPYYFPHWIQNSLKEVGKPFYFEHTDPYPCQIYMIFNE